MKIAVASSGLGHVARGIETWALDTANALRARDVDVTLFAGAEGVEGAIALPCWQRYDTRAQTFAKLSPPFTWRWGFKNAYGWEQWRFWKSLEGVLRDGDFDVLHVQDPMVAYWCNAARRKGRLKTREILAHGTEESTDFRARFDFVQELAPWHLAQARHSLSDETTQHWSAIPNFVDIDVFRPPAKPEERASARARFSLPEDVLVVGCVAAIKRDHKRIDYLIRECAAAQRDLHLVVAGSRQQDTDALVQLAKELLGSRVSVLQDVSRDDMEVLYRTFDVFVLTSLFEMMPIALLEALSSGLPCLVNDHAVLKWMAGDAAVVAMSDEGALAARLEALSDDAIIAAGTASRERAVASFSKAAVIEQYLAYYNDVLAA